MASTHKDETSWRLAAQRLEEGARELGLAASHATTERLLAYLEIMSRWNRTFNLTAIRDPEEMVTRHILDSLAVLPHIPAGTLLDVGSGAGLPGIPLALINPIRSVTLLDKSHKRVDFLTEVAAQLVLPNVTLVCQRVEDYRPARPFDVVIARAFASLHDIVTATDHLLAEHGVLIAMKGALPTEELAAIGPPFVVRAVHAMRVPGLAAKRHLLVLARAP
ncbi:MAG TPA: 16S rRNA (guanine(527)-N(7))-methyltransferase RsmG [Acidiferrobacter sp.]|nr:16S rRNA (guanine(527)-N(7))-methyltransferase RsmG [Acidiferrobacter sp.]